MLKGPLDSYDRTGASELVVQTPLYKSLSLTDKPLCLSVTQRPQAQHGHKSTYSLMRMKS